VLNLIIELFSKKMPNVITKLLSLFRKNLFEVAKEYHQFALNNFKLFKLTRTKMNHPKAITRLSSMFNSCSMNFSDSESLVGLPCRDNVAECNTMLTASNRQAGLRGKIIPLIVSLILLLTIQTSNAQWISQNSGTTNEIWGMQFLNPSTGFIVGGNVIKRTTNGGTSWNNVGSAGFNTLREIINWYGNAWGVTAGHSGAWRTTNEGLNWSTTFATSTYYGMDIKWSGNNLYCVGQAMNYSLTTNWGASWTNGNFSVPGTVGFDIYGINITNNVSPTPMWICGSSANNGGINTPKVCKSTDGGATFSIVLNFPSGVMTGKSLNDVEFTGFAGYACSSNGRIFKTANSGSSWDTTYLGNYNLRQFSFKNASTGFVCGSGGQVFYTTNAGTNWQPYGLTGTTQNLNCIEYASDYLWSAGASGTVIRNRVYLDEVNVSGALAGNGNYLTLTSALNAINAASQTGANIAVTVNRNTTEPPTGAVLNQGDWSSVTIKPASGSAIIVSGNMNPGIPLIDINGADNVTIDGLNSGGSSLTLTNSSTSGVAGTSTVRFQNDAVGNEVTNCNIHGSSQTNFSDVCATVLFGGNAVSTGNDNNTVSNCNIGPAGSSLPACAVYFAGTTGSPSLFNSNDTVRNCNIYDNFVSNSHNAGLAITGGNSSVSIIDNRFYQTSSRTYTSSSLDNHMIYVNCPNGDGFTITGNTLGFSSSSGTGSYTMHSPSQGNLYGIYFNAGTTVQSTIRNNTIAGIQLNGNWNSANFINVVEGNAAVDSNVIGSQTGNSINFTASNSFFTQQVNGIKLWGIGNKTAIGNILGGITAAAPVCYFKGIQFFSTGNPTWVCSDNIIGGTVSNSLRSLATGGQSVSGIFVDCISSPMLTISNNIIRNIESKATGSSFNEGTSGIYANMPNGTLTISRNQIYSLVNTNSPQTTKLSGISIYTGNYDLSRNIVHSLSQSNSASSIIGINSFAPTGICANNMVSIGKDSSGADITTGCSIYGIYDYNGNISFLNNSVLIDGSPETGASNTFALYSVATVDRRYTNNIFMNSRSNSGATGKHYAIRVHGNSPNPPGLICNYNDFFVNGAGGMLGYFNSSDVPDISSWRTVTGKDTNSISADPKFVSTSDLHIDSNVASPVDESGISVAGIADDFDGQTRNATTPDIGADEFYGYKLAEALNFDGGNDYVTLPNSLTQAFTAPAVTEFTIEYWFKGTNLQSAVRFQPTGLNYIVAGWGGNPSTQKHIMSTDGGTSGGVLVGSGVYDGNWHHIAMTWKRNTVNGFRSYLDGALVEAKNAGNVSLPSLATGGFIGCQYNNSEFTNGTLDEVRIWTKALSEYEIALNRFREISSASGLLASYHFNHGIAAGSNTGVTVLTDSSGNDYHGVLNNFALAGETSNWLFPGPGFCPSDNEISVQGNATTIDDGDNSPSAQDHTDFGNVSADTLLTRVFTILNTGDDSLSAGRPLVTGADSVMYVTGNLTPAGKIAPGGSATFTVTFMPSSSGIRNVVIHIPNNDCDEYDYDFAVTGTGTTANAQVLNYDGVNDHVTLPVSLSQNMTSPSVQELTIEYWFKGSHIQSAVRFQSGPNWIVAGWGTPGNEKHLISTEGGTNGISVGAGVSDGNWHHVAMTWKRNTVNGFRSYLDGMLVEQRNSSDTELPSINVAGYLGRYNGTTEWMNGSLDEVRIWTRELSQSEITANMFLERSSGTGLIASYHFNQGFAGDDNSGITSLNDATAYNYDGTLSNFALDGITSNFIAPGPELTPSEITASVSVIPEGFYNAVSNQQSMSDTVMAYLCSSASPFAAVDSALGVINSVSHTGEFTFTNASSGNYYIKLKHRNSIETWSSSAVAVSDNASFDMTSSIAQAFGNNLVQVDGSPVRFAVYSGDVNQDGTVDATDVSTIDNDASNFVSGYVVTDLTGDDFVDGTDFAIADNNAANFVGAITP
jgi:hypothetical protein